jgi:hypothetical protein
VPVVTLTTEQLHWILDGIDIDAMTKEILMPSLKLCSA